MSGPGGAAQVTGPAAPGWRRTHPLGLLARALSYARGAALPLVAAIVGARNWPGGAGAVAMVAVMAFAVNAVVVWLGWRHHRYLVGADEIRVEHGLVRRTARTVPYDRIHDVAIEEPALARLLGLAEIRFETGAGGKDEVTLRYVSREEGEALRETVRARRAEAGQSAGSPTRPGAHADAVEPPPRLLFAMDPRRLLIFGLFEFSLVFFAVLFGLAQQFDAVLPFDIWAVDQWQQRAGGPVEVLRGIGLAAQIAAAVLGVVLLGLAGLAAGLIRTVLRDWGFRLEHTPRGLRRRRGLLTRTDVVVPLHRVQAVAIRTGFVRRRVGPDGGWHRLDLVSLAQDSKSSSHTVVPFGTLAEIAPVAAIAGFPLPEPGTRWHRPSARYCLDRALLTALPAGLLAGALAVAGTGWEALAMLGLAALLALRQAMAWRLDRHALSPLHIHVRRGWLAPRHDIASRVRLQTVEIVEGPLARRRGYADVVFGIAGGTLRIRGIPVIEAHRLRAAVLDSIAGTDFAHLSAPPAAAAP